jgi:mRNA interferase MazF
LGEVVVTQRRGEIWWAETPDEKGRPYLVLTRSAAIPVLNRLLAVPLSTRMRGIPTEIQLGRDEGLPVNSVASLDNVRPVAKALLQRRLGALGPDRLHEICTALNAAVDC